MPKSAQAIALVGPTAVGKTALALSLAQELNAEIVGCDSMQVYQHMQHLSAAPTLAERNQIPHHLVDCIDPTQDFNAGLYYKLAYPLIQSRLDQGKNVLVVGGTGLYLKTLTDGICEAPPSDESVRDSLEAELQEIGAEAFYQKLVEIDAVAAAKLHPNDAKRIVRAMEVYVLTEKPLSQHWKEQHAMRKPCIPMKIIALNRDREKLYTRIEQRNIHMVYDTKVQQELQSLLSMPLSVMAERVHGLIDMRPFFNGEMSFSEAVKAWQQRVRNYAKQQLTWFRNTEGVHWIDLDDYPSTESAAQATLQWITQPNPGAKYGS